MDLRSPALAASSATAGPGGASATAASAGASPAGASPAGAAAFAVPSGASAAGALLNGTTSNGTSSNAGPGGAVAIDGLPGSALPPMPEHAPAAANASAQAPAFGAEHAPAQPDPRTGVLGQAPAAVAQPVPAPVPPGSTGDFLLAAPSLPAGEGGPGAEAEHDPTEAIPVLAPVGTGPLCVGCGAQRIDSDGYCEGCGRAQPRPRDHQERALAGVSGVSDRGHRHHRNEDAFAVAATSRPGGSPAVVAVVCDGVSSATRPDEASEAAAETASESLLEWLESDREASAAMHEAIMAAARRVEALGQEGPPDPNRNYPSCTIVSAVAVDGTVTVGWVGDSRAYWFPDERSGSERLTLDDSWAARMVEAGLMEEAEAYADPRAHAITGWLGADAEEVEPHIVSFVPQVPGVVLICTDGLWNYWEAAADLAAVVPADARTRPLEATQELVRLACERGGHDNITVAVLPCVPLRPGYTPTEHTLPVLGGPGATSDEL
ncbi:PP2C family serine/threonine-protein phosphatase [Streptacidiphilus sp. EB129]|uniref:PP2C family protein-serine/threonine phosphatase n=1 Tax=Streptacidiphilus sp. EB129 TaxID=3156262 RepID=UPI0035113DF3